MSSSTSYGTPYVSGTDTLTSWPTTSQSVANRIDAVSLLGTRPLGTTRLSAAASTMAVSSIPAGFGTLKIFGAAQHSAGTNIDLVLRFNSDTGANYARAYTLAYDSTQAAGLNTAQSGIYVGSCGNQSANRMSSFEVTVPNYDKAFHKSVQYSSFDPRTLTTGAGANADLFITGGGLWASTSAITSVSITVLSGNLVIGSFITAQLVGESI